MLIFIIIKNKRKLEKAFAFLRSSLFENDTAASAVANMRETQGVNKLETNHNT